MARVDRRRTRRRRGGALVEAVLVLPILILLTCGVVEYGYFIFTTHVLHGAARQGARVAIVSGATNTEVAADVGNIMNAAGIASNQYTLAIENAGGTAVDVSTASAGTLIRVRIQCNWGTVGVRPMGLIGTTTAVSSSAVMRKEGYTG